MRWQSVNNTTYNVENTFIIGYRTLRDDLFFQDQILHEIRYVLQNLKSII